MDLFSVGELWPGVFGVAVVYHSGGSQKRPIKPVETPDAAEAELARLMAGPRCRLCENPLLWEEGMHEHEQRLAALICHTCDYFVNNLGKPETRAKAAVVDGYHYVIEPDAPKAAFQGHGGAPFVIRFNDGREVTTCNLWAQGLIPSHLRELFPDTAVFVKQAEYCGYRGHGSAALKV